MSFSQYKPKTTEIAGCMSLYVIIVLILTLSPFEFSTIYFETFIVHHFFSPEPLDLVNNILFFLPWGMLLSHFLPRFRKKDFYGVALAGFLFSLCIEGAQLFLDRSTSGVDLIANTGGALLGYRYMQKHFGGGKWAVKLLAWFSRLKIRRFVFITFVVFLVLLFSYPVFRMNFNNWNERFHLYLGNEGSGDRPWYGELYQVVIYDRALTGEQVKVLQNLSVQRDSLRKELGAILAYSLNQNEGDTVYASAGYAVNMPLFCDSLTWLENENGLDVKGHLIGSVAGGGELTSRLQQTRSFSLEVRFKPANLTQSGPARIVSLSNNTTRRNFMLGQSRQDLYFRVRTPLNGNNGSKIQMQGKNALMNTNRHHVVATFHHGVEKLYVDGRLGGRSLRIDLDYVPRLIRLGKNNAAITALIYLVVLGLTVTAAGLFKRGSVWKGSLTALLVMAGLDGVFHFWLGQSFSSRFWQPVFICLLMVFVQVWMIWPLTRRTDREN